MSIKYHTNVIYCQNINAAAAWKFVECCNPSLQKWRLCMWIVCVFTHLPLSFYIDSWPLLCEHPWCPKSCEETAIRVFTAQRLERKTNPLASCTSHIVKNLSIVLFLLFWLLFLHIVSQAMPTLQGQVAWMVFLIIWPISGWHSSQFWAGRNLQSWRWLSDLINIWRGTG